MMRPIYHTTTSVLHQLNPLSKLIAVVPLFLCLTLFSDVWILLLLSIFHLGLLLTVGRIPAGTMVQALLPLLITLIGFLLFYPPFVGSEIIGDSALLFTLGPLQIHQGGILFTLATCLRLLAFYIVMLVFMLTTDASDLVRALIQQWRINYRIGYGIMIAYRFIPMLEQELRLIRTAQKVRGVTMKKGLYAEFERTRRAFLPLFASAIRNAERKALAMDARAFGAFPTRTYYRRLSFSRRDWFLVLLYWLICTIIAVAPSIAL